MALLESRSFEIGNLTQAGKVTDIKAQVKSRKYESLINQDNWFVPFAVETMGSWDEKV